MATKVNVLVVGKRGAGKTNLVKNLCGKDYVTPAAKQPIEVQTRVMGNLSIHLIDFPRSIELVAKNSKKEFDLLIFCVRIDPGTKFHDNNPELMSWLENSYKDIWKRCIVVFTFSDDAWDHTHSCNPENPQKGDTEYNSYVQRCLNKFQDKLREMKVTDVQAMLISDAGNTQDKILAIPAGLTTDNPRVSQGTWADEILNEIQRKQKNNKLPSIKIDPPLSLLKKAALGAGIGVLVGGPLGAISGATYGVIGAGVGMLIGAGAAKLHSLRQ